MSAMLDRRVSDSKGWQGTAGVLFKGNKAQLTEQVHLLVKVDTQVPGIIWEYTNWRGHMLWRRATARGGR